MTRFNPVGFGAIFVASQERVAPRCGPRTRRATPLATISAGPLRVGHIGAAGCPRGYWAALARCPAGRRAPRPCLRFAPSGPGGPICSHETGQYQRPLVLDIAPENAPAGTRDSPRPKRRRYYPRGSAPPQAPGDGPRGGGCRNGPAGALRSRHRRPALAPPAPRARAVLIEESRPRGARWNHRPGSSRGPKAVSVPGQCSGIQLDMPANQL